MTSLRNIDSIPHKIIFFKAVAIASTSSNVLCFPKEIRIVPLARLSGIRIACNTWEISVFLLSQAEPVEMQIPIRSIR